MEKFAFLVHPLTVEDIAKKYRIAKRMSPRMVGEVFRRRRPWVISEITGIKSATGAEAVGWFVVVPLLPRQFHELEEEYVLEKIIKACNVAHSEGARIVGLGAFTAMPGGGGVELARQVDIPVTTGNTYTTATAIEGARKAAELMGIEPAAGTLAVVGATGSIGSACAAILGPDFGHVHLVGRDTERLGDVADQVERLAPGRVSIATDVRTALADADVVISVTGAAGTVIEPDFIKAGAVVCDVARPRDVSRQVSKARDDVLVIDGSIVKPPGAVRFNLDFGPPPGMCEGCVGETIILALEGRYEPYTLGKNITVDKVAEMTGWAAKHGFELAGLRRLEQLMSYAEIRAIKANAARGRVII